MEERLLESNPWLYTAPLRPTPYVRAVSQEGITTCMHVKPHQIAPYLTIPNSAQVLLHGSSEGREITLEVCILQSQCSKNVSLVIRPIPLLSQITFLGKEASFEEVYILYCKEWILIEGLNSALELIPLIPDSTV